MKHKEIKLKISNLKLYFKARYKATSIEAAPEVLEASAEPPDLEPSIQLQGNNTLK